MDAVEQAAILHEEAAEKPAEVTSHEGEALEAIAEGVEEDVVAARLGESPLEASPVQQTAGPI